MFLTSIMDEYSILTKPAEGVKSTRSHRMV